MVSLSLTLGACEVLLRLVAPRQLPGTTYGKSIKLNARGLRDRDFEVPKSEQVYRIVVLGDSFTWGVGLEIEETFPKLLERDLARCTLGDRIEVINAAHPGHNTVEESLRLHDLGLLYQPDLVLLAYNLNDIEYLPELSPLAYDGLEETPVVELDPGESVTVYSRNAGLRGGILAVERRSLLVSFLVPRVGSLLRGVGLIDSPEFSWVEKLFRGFVDTNPGWLESQRALLEIDDLCRSSSCNLLVAIYPLLVELEDYQGTAAHSALHQFLSGHGIAFVDLLRVFEGSNAGSYWINFLDSHPNARAHRMVADALLPGVCQAIAGPGLAQSAGAIPAVDVGVGETTLSP